MMLRARWGEPVSWLGFPPSNTVSIEGAISVDIDGSSTSTKKEGVAFEAEQSIREAEGCGESHGESIQ